MSKILFLLAPSEGKNEGGNYDKETISFSFEKPLEIANNVTEKDLKCKGDRYLEGKQLNVSIEKGPFDEAIKRYSGVVFNAIDYSGMTSDGKSFFEENVLIVSGMYGMVKPLDHIGNYKLPIESKGLYKFWGDKIAEEISKMKPDFVVNLLPDSYAKLVGVGKCSKLKKIRDLYLEANTKIININFLTEKDGKIVKMSHGVKKYRGEFLKNICENKLIDYNEFGGEIEEEGSFVNINMFIKK